MRHMNRSAIVMVVAIGAVGCVQETAPTVEYFQTHEKERLSQLAQCANDPGLLKGSPLCVNAQQAERLERVGRLRDLPSVGLAPSPRTEAQEEQADKRPN